MVEKPEEQASSRLRESSKHLLTTWLDVQGLAEQNRELTHLLADQLNKIPGTRQVLETIRPLIKTHRSIKILYVTLLVSSDAIETFGSDIFDQAQQALKTLLDRSRVLKNAGMRIEVVPSARDLIVLALSRDGTGPSEHELERLKRALQTEVNDSFRQALEPSLASKCEGRVGRASCHIDSMVPADASFVKLEGLLSETIGKAMQDAAATEASDLTQADFDRLAEPIFDLTTKKVLAQEPQGYEPGTDAPSASSLLRWVRSHPVGLMTFINVAPITVGRPEFRKIVSEALSSPGGPGQTPVVFELSEPSVTTNFDYFKLAAEYFRTLNFGIALRSMRSHYAAFETMDELKPDFVKIGSFLTSGIDVDAIKQELVQALLKLAARRGIPVIAEGISTRAELEKLMTIGITYSQGLPE